MAGKTDRQFFFEVQLNWMADTKGVLSATDANGTINIATPPEFGGVGGSWSAEHLFISSISSCFMSTYLAFSKKFHFEIAGFECNTIGQIELINGRYKFTNINLYPKIYITDETLKEKAMLALEKTHKYCLITNSVNAMVIYHSEILPAGQSMPKIIKDEPELKTHFNLSGNKESIPVKINYEI